MESAMGCRRIHPRIWISNRSRQKVQTIRFPTGHPPSLRYAVPIVSITSTRDVVPGDRKDVGMDGDRFDGLTRHLSQRRRNLLQIAAIGAMGMLGLAAFGDEALAKQCDTNKDCPKGNPRCKGGKCVQCKQNGDCNQNQVCKNNTCKKRK